MPVRAFAMDLPFGRLLQPFYRGCPGSDRGEGKRRGVGAAFSVLTFTGWLMAARPRGARRVEWADGLE